MMIMRLLLLIVLVPHFCFAQGSGGYAFELLRSDEATSWPPFTIVEAGTLDAGLRLFIRTGDPDAVAGLLASGALETQLSDHQAETATSVSLSFGKAVWCTSDGEPIYLGYADPLPDCDGKPPARIQYYFDVPVTLGPSRDLAIGQDPDYLWLIEEN